MVRRFTLCAVCLVVLTLPLLVSADRTHADAAVPVAIDWIDGMWPACVAASVAVAFLIGSNAVQISPKARALKVLLLGEDAEQGGAGGSSSGEAAAPGARLTMPQSPIPYKTM